MPIEPTVAYFSMEIALDSKIPTYSGGLGVLAGDTVRAAADLRLPMIAVTLLHRRGYFHQRIDPTDGQIETPSAWVVEDHFKPLRASAEVSIDSRAVRVRAWERGVPGVSGGVVRVLALDTDVPENSPEHRRLTDSLYGGDHAYRLRQEIVLGIGGVRMLRALGIRGLATYHMNEGHAALLTAELAREESAKRNAEIDSPAVVDSVRSRCVFTTHTPVAAGHDRFPWDMARAIVGDGEAYFRSPLFMRDGLLDTTHAALGLSRYANAVSVRHGEVSRRMFPAARIDSITNGVHPGTWVGPAMARLLDRRAPGWRADSEALRAMADCPVAEVRAAHADAKSALIARVNHDTNAGLSEHAFTIVAARRMTPYKRLDLILSDPARLGEMAERFGPIQIVFSGKSHPRDGGGKDLIRRILHLREAMPAGVRLAFLPGYDMELAGLLVAGADVWLNTPERPLEASGTSGMKAALNGVPSLSILDGWWLEGCDEGVTGWAIGGDGPILHHPESWQPDAASLYDKLERAVLPAFHAPGESWGRLMRSAIAVNGPRFSAHRMVRDYAARAYAPPPAVERPSS